jgi:transcriptional regulator with XRE-family HTH domain
MKMNRKLELFGKKMALARVEQGITETDLATMLDCSRTLIKHIERGVKPGARIDNRIKREKVNREISKLLNIPWEEEEIVAHKKVLPDGPNPATPSEKRLLDGWRKLARQQKTVINSLIAWLSDEQIDLPFDDEPGDAS